MQTMVLYLSVVRFSRLCQRLCNASYEALRNGVKRETYKLIPSKRSWFFLQWKYKPESVRPVTFYSQQLTLANQVKYLGVFLDSKLNWSVHVDAKYKKALAALYQLRRVAGKTWGPHPKLLTGFTLLYYAPCCAMQLLSGGPALSMSLSVNSWNIFKGCHASILQFAKASKKFCQPWDLSGLCTGPMKRPQRRVAAYVVTLPAGKGKGKSEKYNWKKTRIACSVSAVELKRPKLPKIHQVSSAKLSRLFNRLQHSNEELCTISQHLTT